MHHMTWQRRFSHKPELYGYWFFARLSAYNLFTEPERKTYAEIYQKFIFTFAWRIYIQSHMDRNNKLHLFIAVVNHSFAHVLLPNATATQKQKNE